MCAVHSTASASTEEMDYSSDPDQDYTSSSDNSVMEQFRQSYFHIRRGISINYCMFYKYEADLFRMMNRIRIEPGYWESLSPAQKDHFE